MRAGLLARAYGQVPLLKPALSAIWLVAVLGWFTEDSGVTVPAAALPLVLPLVVVILSSVPSDPREPASAPPGGSASGSPDGPGSGSVRGLEDKSAGGPASGAAAPTDRAVSGPAQSGYR
jgi:hypothetical protein